MKDYTAMLELVRGDVEPHTGFVYLMRSAEGTILYIGQTVQPLAVRMRSHLNERPGLVRATARLEAEEMTADLLIDREAELIHQNHPVMNRQCPTTGCYHYNNRTISRREPTKFALSDTELANTIHTAVNETRSEGLDRIFSPDLFELIDVKHPDHNLLPGQIRQKIVAAMGEESRPIYSPTAKKMIRGWYLRNQPTTTTQPHT